MQTIWKLVSSCKTVLTTCCNSGFISQPHKVMGRQRAKRVAHMAFSLAAFSSCRRSTRGSPLIRLHLDRNQTKGGQEGLLTCRYIVLNLLFFNPLLKSDCKIKSLALHLSFPTAVRHKACIDGKGYPWEADNYNSRDSKIPKLIHLEMVAFHLDLEINPHLYPDCITHSCKLL